VSTPVLGRKRKSEGAVRGELFSPSSTDSPAAVASSISAAAEATQRRKKQRTAQLDALLRTSDLLSMCTPATAVADFVKAVCRRVFPAREVWGTRYNNDQFMAGLERYLHLGRHETLQLGQVAAGMRLTQIPWLAGQDSPAEVNTVPTEVTPQPQAAMQESMQLDSPHTQCSSGSEESQMMISPADDIVHSMVSPAQNGVATTTAAKKRSARLMTLALQQVFYKFMEWVYSDFVNNLIAVCFYATEAEGRGSEVLYYRKPVWSRIVQLGKQQLVQNFVPVSCHFCLPFTLPYCDVPFLPAHSLQ
jgi:hypothetical protein